MNRTARRLFGISAVALATLSTQASAASFEDGYKVLSKIVSADPLVRGTLGRNPLKEVLKPGKKIVDQDGNEVISYTKHVGGVRVFGEKSVVVFPKGAKTPIVVQGEADSRTQLTELATLSLAEPEAKISLERAQQIAVQDLRAKGQYLDGQVPNEWLADPEMVMFRNTEGELRLTHHIRTPAAQDGIPTTREFFVDAETGEIVAAYSAVFDVAAADDPTPPPPPPPQLQGTGYGLRNDEIKQFNIVEAEGQFRLNDAIRNVGIFNGELEAFSADADKVWETVGNDRASNQRAEVELYLNFTTIVDFYQSRFNYTWDGIVQAVAHAPDPRTGQGNFNNAYFHPWYNAFFFGDGSGTDGGFDYMGKALDVAGHEFGHGFIEKEGPLTYFGESGALNEHIADLFGACVENDDWQMGEDIGLGASLGKGLRNMQDPANGHGELLTDGLTFDAWRELNKGRPYGDRIYPTKVSQKIICNASQDNGGVHLNSSIFNRFSYLAATGDGLDSEGVGMQQMADIYVHMMKADLYGENATFQEFRNALLVASALHLHDHEKRDAYLRTILKAFNAVGL